MFSKNNGLLNITYWNDLDIIDQGQSKGNVSQFCIYLGYHWPFFKKILNTMMESWLVTKMSYHLTLKMYVKVTIY